MKPKRIQRKRTKGWRLVDHTTNPNGAVCVTRPGKFGNVFQVGHHYVIGVGNWVYLESYKPDPKFTTVRDKAHAVEMFRQLWSRPERIKAAKELRGKDLACYCGPDDACHADVLLEICNAPEEK